MLIRDVYVATRAIAELHCGQHGDVLAGSIAAADAAVEQSPVHSIECVIDGLRKTLGATHCHVDLAVDLLMFYTLQDGDTR